MNACKITLKNTDWASMVFLGGTISRWAIIDFRSVGACMIRCSFPGNGIEIGLLGDGGTYDEENIENLVLEVHLETESETVIIDIGTSGAGIAVLTVNDVTTEIRGQGKYVLNF